jgi:[protein-PII] uridylyltransferase
LGTRIERAREKLRLGSGGDAALVHAVDRLIEDTLAGQTEPYGVRYVLLATGGYGRREMAPGSDVDLLFLTDNPDGIALLVQACLHRWWDAGLKLGYATRTMGQTLELAGEDLKTAMSLLDVRVLAGDPAFAVELSGLLWTTLYRPHRLRLLHGLLEERQQRHSRFGDTVFMLEPDIKLGEGGLRDMHGARYAARIVGGTTDLSDVGLTELEATQLDAAYGELTRFRGALHGVAGPRCERLFFSHQEALAERLMDRDVPACMQRYWRAAARVRSLTRRVLDTLRVQCGEPVGPTIELPVGTTQIDPTQVLSLFRRSSEERVRLHPRALEAAATVIPQLNEVTRRTPRALDDFFAILTDPDDRARPLTALHEVGLLGAFVPEFRCVSGLYQHNAFHVYTVDVHTIEGIKELKRLSSEEAPVRDSQSEASLRKVMGTLSVEEKRVLFLALLLHDTNKGGMDPASTYTAATRMGLTHANATRLEQLVREHLLLALLSQTRDIHDETTQLHLAREVGDRRTLALLYVLTHADMSSANPDLLTAWKASLLQGLYEKTDARLAVGLDVYADDEHIVRQRRTEVLTLLLGVEPEVPTARTRKVDRFFATLPTRYFAATKAEQILGHVELVAAFSRSDEPAQMTLVDFGDGSARITAVCADQPGLLARHAGVLAAHGVNILASTVYVLKGGLTLDLFRVQTPVPWERLKGSMIDVVAGLVDPIALLESRKPPAYLAPPPTPMVPTCVTVDLKASTRYAVVDVVAADRTGLLFQLASTLHAIGLDVGLARVTTEGHVVRDAFYVRPIGGGALSPDAIETLIERVTAAISQVD